MAQKPWLAGYDPGVPHTLAPYPDGTLLDVFADTVKQRPLHPALIFHGRSIPGSAVERLSTDFAAALLARGVKKGDRVVLLLPNCPQGVICQFGAWWAGGVAVPLNPLYTETELEHMLNECGAEVAVVLTPFYAKLKAIQARTRLRLIIATNIKEYLPAVLRLLFTAVKEKKEGHRITLAEGDVWLTDLLKAHVASLRPGITLNPADPAIILFSGGTTGAPKAAVGTHRALLMSAMQLHAWFAPMLLDWDDIVMQVLPLFHVYGNVGVLSAALVGHNPVVLVPNPRDRDDVIATIRKVRPSFLPGVPTLFIALLNHPDVKSGKADLKSLKLCISGAAPLLAETKKQFEEVTRGRIVEGYGLTESMMGAVVNPVRGKYKAGSIGLPVTDVEVRIVDVETGKRTLRSGEVGEILMKAPQVMLGYLGRPAETAEVLRDGWLFTGDIGYMDEDGYIFIVERKKDLIKAGGYQVWPREVEEVIAAMPGVLEVAVGGVPDPYRGETVKAWIIPQPGQKLTAEEVIAFARQKLAAYKAPTLVEFRDNLPKTMVGKVLRRELIAEHKAKQAAS